MSREADRCARCPLMRAEHSIRGFSYDHAFVEPARAEAPQGETRRCCACGVQCERPCNTETDSICEDCQCRPAAQPETGGDEARDWLARHNEFRKCLGCELCFAYAAGRASRDLNDDEYCSTECMGYSRDDREKGFCVYCAAPLAARRGSGR